LNPTRREIVITMIGIMLTVVMAALDQSAVVPALPAIARELHGLAHVSWVVSAYLLTSTALTLVYGKLGDTHGRRTVMQFAIVLFVGASLLSALTADVLQLVLARALQGAGAAGLIVSAQATMADLVAPRERARYQVFVTTTFAIVSAAGPPVGGYFVDHLSWRWVFWLNLPVGAVAFLIARRLPQLEVRSHRSPIDYPGLALLTTAIALLLSLVSWGGALSKGISALGCAALFAAFVRRERTIPNPVFPPRLFANAILRHGTATAFALSMLLFGAMVLVPTFLQLVVGIGAGSSGALMVPMLLGMATASTAGSQYMRRTGRYKVLLPLGLLMTTAAFVLLSTMNAGSSSAAIAWILLLLGLSVGASMPTLNIAVQNSADARDIGIAVSMVTFARSLGGAFGAAVFWALLLGVLAGDLERTTVDARARAFHVVFLAGAALAGVILLAALRLREVPLHTERPSERMESAAAP
jgi:EmrB/QacA subfamily drug resistance transporter